MSLHAPYKVSDDFIIGDGKSLHLFTIVIQFTSLMYFLFLTWRKI